MTRYCTVPNILNCRQWWEDTFGVLCKAHDEAYVRTLNILVKLWSDLVMIYGMIVVTITMLRTRQWLEGCGCILWTLGAILALPTLGTLYWAFMRILERSVWLQSRVLDVLLATPVVENAFTAFKARIMNALNKTQHKD